MKITKEQQKTLNLIDSQFQKLEQLSKSKGIDLNELDEFMGYGFPNFAAEQEKQMISKNRSRQEVFEKSKKVTSQSDRVFSTK